MYSPSSEPKLVWRKFHFLEKTNVSCCFDLHRRTKQDGREKNANITSRQFGAIYQLRALCGQRVVYFSPSHGLNQSGAKFDSKRERGLMFRYSAKNMTRRSREGCRCRGPPVWRELPIVKDLCLKICIFSFPGFKLSSSVKSSFPGIELSSSVKSCFPEVKLSSSRNSPFPGIKSLFHLDVRRA